MTIEEMEAACDRGEKLDFRRHALEVPELTLCETFYPHGFATELHTNSTAILSLARELWSVFEPQVRDQTIRVPIRVDVHVVRREAGKDNAECPPAPVVHMQMPLIVSVADGDNFSIVNLDEGWTRIVVAESTQQFRSYLGYFFVGSAPLCHIASRHATPIHAGCVAFEGRGMLLCGDSGAGKSTLSYACARAGWTYVTDDASYLLHDGRDRLVTGNCHQVRFRPTAGMLFPEIDGLEITPRAAGKPSIELPTAALPWMRCSPTSRVNWIVFLNRRAGSASLLPYRKDVARCSMRQVLFGSAESLAVQYGALEQLLTAPVFELRYSEFDWAVERLKKLALEGC